LIEQGRIFERVHFDTCLRRIALAAKPPQFRAVAAVLFDVSGDLLGLGFAFTLKLSRKRGEFLMYGLVISGLFGSTDAGKFFHRRSDNGFNAGRRSIDRWFEKLVVVGGHG